MKMWNILTLTIVLVSIGAPFVAVHVSRIDDPALAVARVRLF